jgi:hypothetical protein
MAQFEGKKEYDMRKKKHDERETWQVFRTKETKSGTGAPHQNKVHHISLMSSLRSSAIAPVLPIRF